MKSWLTAGGVTRVKLHLNKQMVARQFSLKKQAAVNDVINAMAREHRQELLSLMASDVIASDRKELLNSFEMLEGEFDRVLQLIISGNNPFEKWMKAHGYSNDNISAIYKIIDDWLVGEA